MTPKLWSVVVESSLPAMLKRRAARYPGRIGTAKPSTARAHLFKATSDPMRSKTKLVTTSCKHRLAKAGAIIGLGKKSA